MCSAQNTDTNVNASSDGSGCKIQGSCARQRSSVRARSGTTAAANNGGWEVQGAANGGNGPTARTRRASAQTKTGVQARAVMLRATVAVNRRQGRL